MHSTEVGDACGEKSSVLRVTILRINVIKTDKLTKLKTDYVEWGRIPPSSGCRS